MIVSLAAGGYAHLAGLGAAGQKGDPGDGLEIRRTILEPGRIFPRMLADTPWDVAEMSLATIYILAAKNDRRFVALPVFPSRTFRHSALYVPAASPLKDAGELRGARIGVLRYAMTTAVWVRELLSAHYGVPAQSLQWVVGEDSPYSVGVSPRIVGGGAALEAMAVAGELDCLISGRTPAAFATGGLRRLFPDFGSEEKAYYARTRVFPIMHVMVARRALVEQQPGLVAALTRRFEAAKHSAIEGLANFDVSTYPLPWLPAYVEDARRNMSGELWPYGVAANRTTLLAFGAALAADGLTAQACTPEQVFADA